MQPEKASRVSPCVFVTYYSRISPRQVAGGPPKPLIHKLGTYQARLYRSVPLPANQIRRTGVRLPYNLLRSDLPAEQLLNHAPAVQTLVQHMAHGRCQRGLYL